MKIDCKALASARDEDIARLGDCFLEALFEQGMTDEAMPNLALLFHQMSLSAAMWRRDKPRSRVVSHREDNVVHVEFVAKQVQP